MTTVESRSIFENFWKAILVWGVLTLLLGVVVLVWPGKTILVAAALFGVYLVVSGIAQVFAGVVLDVSGGSRVLLFVSGALSTVLGIFAFREFSHGAAIWLLGIWIGVGFIFQGVTEAAVAISFKELPERGWHIFLGILTSLAGVVVLAWPFDSILLLTIVAGAWLVAIGITQIVWAFRARRAASKVERGIQRMSGGQVPA